MCVGRVLGVDGDEPRARREPSGDERPSGDARLLVRERDETSGVERGERRAQTGRADDRVEDDVGVRVVARAATTPSAPSRTSSAGNRSRTFAAASASAIATRAGEKRSICSMSAAASESAASAWTVKRSGVRAMTSRVCVPIDPVDPRTVTADRAGLRRPPEHAQHEVRDGALKMIPSIRSKNPP